MKNMLLIAALIAITTPAFARDEYVRGHIRRDGTYVEPHYRSSPNSNPYDNYSTQGNYNPYTGQQGTVDPYEYQIRRQQQEQQQYYR